MDKAVPFMGLMDKIPLLGGLFMVIYTPEFEYFTLVLAILEYIPERENRYERPAVRAYGFNTN